MQQNEKEKWQDLWTPIEKIFGEHAIYYYFHEILMWVSKGSKISEDIFIFILHTLNSLIKEQTRINKHLWTEYFLVNFRLSEKATTIWKITVRQRPRVKSHAPKSKSQNSRVTVPSDKHSVRRKTFSRQIIGGRWAKFLWPSQNISKSAAFDDSWKF